MGKTSKGNRSVKIDFGVSGATDDQIVSFDVVPAFTEADAYTIPDRREGARIKTNARIHAAMKWNGHNDKPIKPSFLLEVMALDLLAPPWGGSYPRELGQFFASAASSLDEEWADPAGLGPAVSARLAEDPSQRDQARRALLEAEVACTEGIRLEQSGRTGAARSRKWVPERLSRPASRAAGRAGGNAWPFSEPGLRTDPAGSPGFAQQPTRERTIGYPPALNALSIDSPVGWSRSANSSPRWRPSACSARRDSWPRPRGPFMGPN